MCIGKNIAIIEICVAIPILFGQLDVSVQQCTQRTVTIADIITDLLGAPKRDWTAKGSFFSRQHDMDIKVSWRIKVPKQKDA